MAAELAGSAGPATEHEHRLRVAPAHVRSPLVNPRTLVGALLVTLSGLGLFVLATDDGGEGSPVVLAARDLRPGQRLDAEDLSIARGSLPPGVGAFTTVEDLRGRVVLGPVGAGEIVQVAAVSADRTGEVESREVALALPRAQVAVGRLGIGDRVDVFVTRDDRTSSVVRGAAVVHVADGGDGLARASDVRVVVAVEEDAAVAALVHALRTGEITIVRSTFAAEQGAPIVHPPEADGDPEREGDDDG